jgi:hypothetical protein
MSRFPGFIGATYQLRSYKADSQRCLNLYPELVESLGAANGEIGYLLKVPGLKRLATIGTGPIRGAYVTNTGRLAVVSGSKLYSVGVDWVPKESGTLATATGPVDMADNGSQLVVVDGTSGYVVSLITGVFQKITSEFFMGATRVWFIDGYFMVNNPGTGQFQISSLYDGITWDGLDFGVAEGLPDPVVAGLANNRQAWIFGSKSVEVYWNSGDPDFPFSRIDGSFIEHGCAAAFTAQKFAGTVAWLSDKGQVLMANGFQPQRISNHAVERAIAEAGDVSAARAWTHTEGGHAFYCLALPGASTTWCYDLNTSQWHERAEMVGGAYVPSRVSCCAYAYGVYVAGDATDGRIYQLDPATYDNDGAPLAWERTAPRLNKDGVNLFASRFELEMETGVGLDGLGQGTDPKIMLQVSRDGGATWGTELWTGAGRLGQFRHRAVWRRLGFGRDLVFKVRGTDPVKTVLMGANLDIEAGVH